MSKRLISHVDPATITDAAVRAEPAPPQPAA